MLNITNKWWISLPAKKGQDILIKCECGHNFSIDSQTIEDMPQSTVIKRSVSSNPSIAFLDNE